MANGEYVLGVSPSVKLVGKPDQGFSEADKQARTEMITLFADVTSSDGSSGRSSQIDQAEYGQIMQKIQTLQASNDPDVVRLAARCKIAMLEMRDLTIASGDHRLSKNPSKTREFWQNVSEGELDIANKYNAELRARRGDIESQQLTEQRDAALGRHRFATDQHLDHEISYEAFLKCAREIK